MEIDRVLYTISECMMLHEKNMHMNKQIYPHAVDVWNLEFEIWRMKPLLHILHQWALVLSHT